MKNDNEIIKALEICADYVERGAALLHSKPTEMTYKGVPLQYLFKDTLDLINRLKAQNQEFDEKIIMQLGLIDYQKAEIEKISNLLKLETEGANTLNDVIAEQNAEIERLLDRIDQQVTIIGNLEVEVEAMRGAANSYKAEVERLQALNELEQFYGTLTAETFQVAKSEAIKEFAERLKEQFTIRPTFRKDTMIVCDIVKETIDSLVKEMIGE